MTVRCTRKKILAKLASSINLPGQSIVLSVKCVYRNTTITAYGKNLIIQDSSVCGIEKLQVLCLISVFACDLVPFPVLHWCLVSSGIPRKDELHEDAVQHERINC